MGLSGRKTKQRIASDPRNLSWANDAAKFGQTYLSKLGWDLSQGLGVNGDGRTSHIQVSQKLDVLGIGAAQQRDPNGISWKQHHDFENLLERLNTQQGGSAPKDGMSHPASRGVGFIAAVEVSSTGADLTVDSGREGIERKTDEARRERKKRKRSTHGSPGIDEKEEQDSPEGSELCKQRGAYIGSARIRASRAAPHRAKLRASKNIATKSAAAISEVLGIAATSPTPSPISTPAESISLSAASNSLSIELGTVTTSSISLSEYFQRRLLAKSAGSSISDSPATADSDIPTPKKRKRSGSYGVATPGLGSSTRKRPHS